MPWILSFPGLSQVETYNNLETKTEVAEALYAECEQTISDMGSEGYDLIFPTHAPSDPEALQEWLDRAEDAESIVQEAHQRGIDEATRSVFDEAWNALWYGADEDIHDFRLPDGTKLALTWKAVSTSRLDEDPDRTWGDPV